MEGVVESCFRRSGLRVMSGSTNTLQRRTLDPKRMILTSSIQCLDEGEPPLMSGGAKRYVTSLCDFDDV